MITRKLNEKNLPFPTQWHEIFGAERPLIVEIGFGNADYLLHLAHTRPDCNIVGLEISNQSMEKAERKIQKAQLHHVCAVHARAETVLHHVLEPASVSEFHINNPDPWFKKRHSRRRLIQRDTLDAMVSRLIPGGWLYLATDVLAYAEMSHELLSATPGLDNTLNTPWTDSLPGRIVTKYEARGLREGNPAKLFRYQRNHQPAPDIPVLRELPVPHLVLQTPLTAPEILAQFTPMTHHAGDDIFVTYIHAFVNQRQNTLLIEANITEPTIEQHVALMLFPREEPGTYTLKYGTLGSPRITTGLHRATAFLGNWIVSLHPESAILHASLQTERSTKS